MLTVHVPPDFLLGETSSDVMVREGGQVRIYHLRKYFLFYILHHITEILSFSKFRLRKKLGKNLCDIEIAGNTDLSRTRSAATDC